MGKGGIFSGVNGLDGQQPSRTCPSHYAQLSKGSEEVGKEGNDGALHRITMLPGHHVIWAPLDRVLTRLKLQPASLPVLSEPSAPPECVLVVSVPALRGAPGTTF